MEKNEHSIQRLKLDLTLQGSENSQGMEAHLNEILRDRIFQLLEQELDRIDVAGQRLRIDQLELNLGAMPSKIVDEEFPVRFVERLKEKLLNFEREEGKGESRIEESRTHLDAIRHYFMEGAFPWWFNAHKTSSLDDLVQQLLNSNDAAMAQVIKSELHNRNFVKRLTGQLQIPTLQKLLRGISPTLNHKLFAQVDELFQVLSQAYETKLDRSHAALSYQALFEQMVLGTSHIQTAVDAVYHSLSKLAHVAGVRRETVVATLLQDQKLNRHSVSFVQTLEGLSQYELADDAHGTLAAKLKRKKQAPNFKDQFTDTQTVLEEKVESRTQPNLSVGADRIERVVHHYMQHGSIPVWASDYSAERLGEELLKQIVAKTPEFEGLMTDRSIAESDLKARWLRVINAILPEARQKVSWRILHNLKQLRKFLEEEITTTEALKKHFKHVEQIGQTLLFYDGVSQAEDLQKSATAFEEIRENKDVEDIHDELGSLLSDAQIGVADGELSSKENITDQLLEEVRLLEALKAKQSQAYDIEAFTPSFLADVIAFYLTHGKWPWWMNPDDQFEQASKVSQLFVQRDTTQITFDAEAGGKSSTVASTPQSGSAGQTWELTQNNNVFLQLIEALSKKDQKEVETTLSKLAEHDILLRRIIFQLPSNTLKKVLEAGIPQLDANFWKAVSKLVQRVENEVPDVLSKYNVIALVSNFMLKHLSVLQAFSADELKSTAARLIAKLFAQVNVAQGTNTSAEAEGLSSHSSSSSSSPSSATEALSKEGSSSLKSKLIVRTPSSNALAKAKAHFERASVNVNSEVWTKLENAAAELAAPDLYKKLTDEQVFAYLTERGSLPMEGATIGTTDFVELLQRTFFNSSSKKHEKKGEVDEVAAVGTTAADDIARILSPKAQIFIFNVIDEHALDNMLTPVLLEHKRELHKTVQAFSKLLAIVAADRAITEVNKGGRKALFALLHRAAKQLTPAVLLEAMISDSSRYLRVPKQEWELRWLFALNVLKSSPNHGLAKASAIKPLLSKSFISKLGGKINSAPKTRVEWIDVLAENELLEWGAKVALHLERTELANAIRDAVQSSNKKPSSQVTSDEEAKDHSDVSDATKTVPSQEDQKSSGAVIKSPIASPDQPPKSGAISRKDEADETVLTSQSVNAAEQLENHSAERNLPTDEETLEELRNDPQVCMDTLYFFLVFGSLPWWSVYANVKELEKYVRALAKSQQALFKAHLERLLNDRLVGNRLRDYFDDLLDLQAVVSVKEEQAATQADQVEAERKAALQEVKVLDWLLKAEHIESATLEALQEYLPIYLRRCAEQGISLTDQPELLLQLSAQLLSIRLGKSYAEVLELLEKQTSNWQSHELNTDVDDKQALRISMEQVVTRLQEQLDKLWPNADAVEAATARYRAVDHNLFEGDNEAFMRFIGQHLLSKFESEEFSTFFNLLNFSRGVEAPQGQLESLFTNALYYLSIRDADSTKDMVRQLFSAADAETQFVVQQLKQFDTTLAATEPKGEAETDAEKEQTNLADSESKQEETAETDIANLQSHIEARLLSEFTTAFLKLAPKLNFGNYQEQLHTVFYLSMAQPVSRTGIHQAIRDFLKVVAQKEQKDVKSILIYLLDQVDRAEGRPFKYLPQLVRHSLGELALGQKLIPQFAKQELEPVLTTFNYALYHEQSERIEWLYESAATYLALKSNKTMKELAHDILVNVDPGQAMRHGSYYRILERVGKKTRTDLSKAEQRLLNSGDVDLQEILRRKEHTYRIMDLIAELTLLFERVVPELKLTSYLRGTNKDWYVVLAQRGRHLDIDALVWHWFLQLVRAERYGVAELLSYLLEQAKASGYAFANLNALFKKWLSTLPVSSPKERTRTLPQKEQQESVLEHSVESQLVQSDKQELLKKFTDALETSDYLLEEILDNTLATFSDEEGLRKEYEEMLLEKHDWGDNEQADDKLYISNAGIVLVWPFLPRFFNNLGYMEKGQFKGREFQERAVHVLQYLVDARENVPEYTLMLNKLMCGMEVKEAIKREIVLTEAEKHECEVLLKTVIVQWDAVKNTPVDAFRQSFFQREGALFLKNGKWNLNVERKAYDVILKTLPWGLSLVRFSWSDNVIYLEWKA